MLANLPDKVTGDAVVELGKWVVVVWDGEGVRRSCDGGECGFDKTRKHKKCCVTSFLILFFF